MALPLFTITPNSKLCYYKEGTGPKTILLFHGFGQDHSVFSSYAHALGPGYTLYAFDLYFHGQSEWHPNDYPISKESWKEIITQFLKELKIERFSLLAFSIGARFALAAVEAFPERIDHLFLLAPDGIRKNFWYTMATSTMPMRALFKSFVKNPGRFSKIVHLARRLNLVSPAMLDFVQSQMDTQEKRMRVYHSWVVFRKLRFNLPLMAHLINDHSIVVTVILGKRDAVIQAQNVSAFTGLLKQSRLEIIPAGHTGIVREAAQVISKFS